MSRQFVLIDQSIEGSAGHYLEYARRVLSAAKAQGFRTVLATNQRSQNLECSEADLVLNVFSKTFWENQAQSAFRSVIGFLFKSHGMAIELKNAAKFSEELSILVKQARIKEGDIVFIPTLGSTELMGVSLFSASKESSSIYWHLLFRRDIPIPSSWFDIWSKVARWKVRASFTLANKTFSRGLRYFYTDTEELSRRYESLGVGDFKTLPIPIDQSLGYKRQGRQGPLVVSYLGDLRSEKGVHHLPKIIASLRDKGFDSSWVIFRIQANLATGVPTLSTLRAKKILTNNKLHGVEMVSGPLDSAVYHDLLLGSDVVLLPYSTESYIARSSGIFAEAIAAGIPTIHPRDSWLGRNAPFAKNGYSEINEITDILEIVLQDYLHHEKNSREACEKWRNIHSAKRLIQILINNSVVEN